MFEGPVDCFSFPSTIDLLVSRGAEEEEGNAPSRLFTTEEEREITGEEMELGRLDVAAELCRLDVVETEFPLSLSLSLSLLLDTAEAVVDLLQYVSLLIHRCPMMSGMEALFVGSGHSMRFTMSYSADAHTFRRMVRSEEWY